MGLRINTNISAIRALRTLRLNDRLQSRSLERLATGLRINRGADDPAGLVISEQLRAQLRAMDQAVTNSQNASNLLSIADAALQEASDLLIEIQDALVFAQNTGGASPAQIAAEQDAVDQAIAAIDRIASTTRYADRPLLNGSAEFQQISGVPTELQNVVIRNVDFAGGTTQRTLSIAVDINPQRATLDVQGAGTSGTTTLRITGERGTQDVVLASGITASSIAGAINNVAGFTGVFASAYSGGANLQLRSESFGESELIKVEVIGGQLTGSTFSYLDESSDVGALAPFTLPVAGVMNPADMISDTGRDGQVSFEGQAFTGVGNQFSILASTASFEFSVNPDDLTTDDGTVPALVNAGAALSFTLASTGLVFQLNEQPLPTDRLSLGVVGVQANRLGFDPFRDRIAEAGAGFASQVFKGGFLNTLKTGAGNDLFQNPENAHEIVNQAIADVAGLRGFLGAVQADAIEPNVNSLSIAIENLSASLSDIRDLDFAEETANFTKSQILFQSGIAVLASANLIPQSVLTLLS